MKKLLLLLTLGILTTACHEESVTPPQPQTNGEARFVGTLTVTPNEGSHFSAFEASKIEFIITRNQSLKQEEDLHYIDLAMPQIKFVEQMPVWISLELPGLTAQQAAIHPTCTVEFSEDSMIPYYMGQPYDPQGDGKYTITHLVGCYETSKTLHVEFDCYTMHVDYRGEWVTTSTPMEEVIR